MIKISVVIPCYNASKTITPCLASVVSQTVLPFEVIIVDDGSTDQTVNVIRQFLSTQIFPVHFHLIEQENAGPSAARNKGVSVAQGNWIAFLDADDYWTPIKLSVQLKAVALFPDAVMFGGANVNAVSPENASITADVEALAKRGSLISLRKLLFKNYFLTPTILIRKDIFESVQFDTSMRHSEDYRLWLRVVTKFPAVFIPIGFFGFINNKHAYADQGLSSSLWKMERGELSNYRYLYQEKQIGFPLLVASSSVSLLKYFRRCLITVKRSFKRKEAVQS